MSRDELQDEWARRLTEYSGSGMSQKQWCQMNGVPLHQFLYWRGKLNKGAKAGVSREDTGGENGWWQLEVKPESSSIGPGLEVRVGEASIQVSPGFDGELLAAIVRALTPR